MQYKNIKNIYINLDQKHCDPKIDKKNNILFLINSINRQKEQVANDLVNISAKFADESTLHKPKVKPT